jgi:hypothetical protein
MVVMSRGLIYYFDVFDQHMQLWYNPPPPTPQLPNPQPRAVAIKTGAQTLECGVTCAAPAHIALRSLDPSLVAASSSDAA